MLYEKALNLSSLEECSRRYGPRANNKDVCKVVLEFFKNKISLNCNILFVLVYYDLCRDKRKKKYFNIHSVLNVVTPP